MAKRKDHGNGGRDAARALERYARIRAELNAPPDMPIWEIPKPRGMKNIHFAGKLKALGKCERTIMAKWGAAITKGKD